ncbi:MAG TPA: CDP-alcohol phosphatidyltransferase family protein, partial [Allosphingosinicella sp.]
REKSAAQAIVGFATAADADRRIAGVAAAARAVKTLADGGAGFIQMRIADGGAPAAATRDDIERLRGTAAVEIAQGAGPAPDLPGAWRIVRATGKKGDGLVSRLFNRPISQRISWLLLHFPGLRPVHITAFNALLALVMAAVTLTPGQTALIAGGILFQAASLLDGVDGEMARATFRTSAAGATMDSVVDIATNLLFVSALTFHLAMRDGPEIGWIGAWAVFVSILGGVIIGRRARSGGGPIGFDLLKRSDRRIGGPVDLIYWVVQTLTGRDVFAFLYMVLIIVGLERVALCIYAGVGAVWIVYVVASLLPWPKERFRGAA